MLEASVLLLNQNYEPLSLCSARRAILLVWSGKAEVIKHTECYIRSVSATFSIPAVIRLLIFVRITRRLNVQLTKQNILRRDHKVCQYCGRTEVQMTVDHVVPKSQGGLDTWENLVCACSSCNNRKGDNTPERVGMRLLKIPRKPNLVSFLFTHKGSFSESWKSYL
ncbi:MAG: HNH endonuclease [Candidatus Nanopelagicales bacterium]